MQLNPPNIAPETMSIQILILPANSNVHRFLLIHYKPLEQDDRVCRFFSKFDPLNLIWQNCQEVKLLLASIGDQSLFALHNTNLNKNISRLRFKINAIIRVRDVGMSENRGGREVIVGPKSREAPPAPCFQHPCNQGQIVIF